MPAEAPELDAFLFRPVIAGLWTHAQAVDGTFTITDLLDAHDILDLKAENEARHRRWIELNRDSS